MVKRESTSKSCKVNSPFPQDKEGEEKNLHSLAFTKGSGEVFTSMDPESLHMGSVQCWQLIPVEEDKGEEEEKEEKEEEDKVEEEGKREETIHLLLKSHLRMEVNQW